MPSQLINFGAAKARARSSNMLGALLSILTAEKLGIEVKPEEKT